MKKILKYVGCAVALIVLAVAALLTYVKVALPDVGVAEDIKIEYTPERLERGRYLASSVYACMDCHSKRDWTKFSGPLVEGTLGRGGETFDQSLGLPGKFVSRNITPAGIGRYTDGELVRVITTGVNKEGSAMFPLMPFIYYGNMDQEDVYSIITYLRSIPSIEHATEESSADFPMNFIIDTIPQKGNPMKKPEKSDTLAYGGYLIATMGCIECHTQVSDKGMIIPEVSYAGGREFPFPSGSIVRSSNITPDKETGIGQWTEEMFVRRFKMYGDSSYVEEEVGPGEFNTWMPWTMYGQMDETELSAIFAHLKTLKPINNKVVKFTSKK